MSKVETIDLRKYGILIISQIICGAIIYGSYLGGLFR
jgi:hypothetical protein